MRVVTGAGVLAAGAVATVAAVGPASTSRRRPSSPVRMPPIHVEEGAFGAWTAA